MLFQISFISVTATSVIAATRELAAVATELSANSRPATELSACHGALGLQITIYSLCRTSLCSAAFSEQIYTFG